MKGAAYAYGPHEPDLLQTQRQPAQSSTTKPAVPCLLNEGTGHCPPSTKCCFAPLQGKPYALFGTCLGAIVAYEVTKRIVERKHAPMPLALFPAAVSPPHLYAIAVMKLYVQHAVGE